MSDNLTLRYVINLVGDLKKRAAENARAVEDAGKRQEAALKKVDKAVTTGEKVVTKAGQAAEAALQSTEQNMVRVERSTERVTQAVRRADASLSRMGTNSSSLQRTTSYLAGMSRRLDDVRIRAERVTRVLARTGQVGAAVGAGAVAGGAVAAAQIRKPMAFDQQLANLANVAYSDRTPAGRILGMKDLENAIDGAVAFGGGNRESAATALSDMLASGVIKLDAAVKLLPDIQQTATAADANVGELAQISIRAMQNFGVTIDQIPALLSKAIVAGQEGGFELKDMSKWLPQMMAVGGGMLGMRGVAGFEQLLAASQASVITAGTKDEAGNNLVNLLAKINSADTQKDFSKIELVDPTDGKKKGIDLRSSLAKARSKGVQPLDAFVSLVDQVAASDKEYVDLRKRAASQTGDERKATLTSMADIMEGGAIGKVIQDRQALMALIALMQNKDYMKTVLAATGRDSGGATNSNYAVVSSRASFAAEQANNELDKARSRVFEQLDAPMQALLKSTTELAWEFPVLTSIITGSIQAISIGAAAGGVGALTGWLLNRGKGGAAAAAGLDGAGGAAAGASGARGPTPGAGGLSPRRLRELAAADAAAASRGSAAIAGIAGGASKVLRFAGPIGYGLSAIEAGSIALDSDRDTAQKSRDLGVVAAGLGGAVAGGKLGALAGAAFGPAAPITVPVGAMLGGAAGYFGASWLQGNVSDIFAPRSKRAPAYPLPAGAMDSVGLLEPRAPSPLFMSPQFQPGAALSSLGKSEPQRVEVDLKNARVSVDVRVADDRARVTSQVTQQFGGGVRIDAGATNPGGN